MQPDPPIVVAMAASRPGAGSRERAGETPIFIDLDSVLVTARAGRRGPELYLQPDVEAGLVRLSQVAGPIVVLVDPSPPGGGPARDQAARLGVLRSELGDALSLLVIVTCPHGSAACTCRKPGTGLIEHAAATLDLSLRRGWHIGADQEGVQSARSAGLSTIRIGPVGEDHLSTVHRADHEARDLLDAANWIMLDALAHA
jgi:hypothetical protein